MLLFHSIRYSILRKSRFLSPPIRRLSELVSSSQLGAMGASMDRLRFVDTRSQDEFRKGHVSGAANIPIMQYFVGQSTPEVLEVLRNDLCKNIGDAGINRKDTVIIYEATQHPYFPSFCCAGHFLLKYVGCENVSILHDGLEGWKRNNLPISTTPTQATPVLFDPKITKEIMLTKEDVLAGTQDKQTVILDCRDEDEWLGKISAPSGWESPRKGRIPGAKWIKWTDLMDTVQGARKFKSPQEIREICKQKAGIEETSKVVVYCFIGARSSNTMVALKSAGIQNVANYFSSWNEWSRDDNLPIEN